MLPLKQSHEGMYLAVYRSILPCFCVMGTHADRDTLDACDPHSAFIVRI
jgi:hypothetical protein